MLRKKSAEISTSQLNSAFKNLKQNDINHILQEKHDWGKVVKDPNSWKQIKKVITKVMKEGKESPYGKKVHRVQRF